MSEQGSTAPETAIEFFRDRFGLDETALTAALGTALEREVDYADLFFEYSTQDSVSLEEGIVKGGSRQIEQGVGVRALRGARQGYAHSDEISVESVRLAAATARAISEQSRDKSSVPVRTGAPGHNLYAVENLPTEVPVETKIDLLGEIDTYARAQDRRVQEVMASLVCELRNVLVAGSDGSLAGDVRPLVRLNVQVIVADGGKTEIGYQGMGGRYELERLLEPGAWKPLVDEAVRLGTLNSGICKSGRAPKRGYAPQLG